MKKWLTPLAVLVGIGIASAEPKVRIVYLVPSDKAQNTSYVAALQNAIYSLQIWYGNELGNGKSFLRNSPSVETFVTSHPAYWYSTNPNGDFWLWLWNNVLQDASELVPWQFADPNNRWIFYIDADPACGQLGGGGTTGVAVMTANDLRGLTGEEYIPPCPDDFVDTAGPCRWVGGMGHELGHAFDLPHPAACDSGQPDCPSNALMWLGYRTYPDTFLTSEDKAALNQSPFFVPTEITGSLPSCEALPLAIDIRPGSTRNLVLLGSTFPVTVSILTSDTFDALGVDPSTLSFGPLGASPGGAGRAVDVDRDGDLDLLVWFRTNQTGIECGATEATLWGATWDGTPVVGADSVVTMGCP